MLQQRLKNKVFESLAKVLPNKWRGLHRNQQILVQLTDAQSLPHSHLDSAIVLVAEAH